MRFISGAVLAGLTFTAACTGIVGDTGEGDDAAADVGEHRDPLCEGAPQQLRMLSRDEVAASLNAVFGVPAVDWIGIVPPDPPAEGYVMATATSTMSDERLEQLLAVSNQVADAVAANAPVLAPCASTTADAECLASFVRDRLPIAYRRPTSEAEVQAVVAVAQAALDDGMSFADAMGQAAAAMSLAPHHLYRFEISDDDGELSDFAIAELLAFGLTGAPPDEALRRAAEQGELRDAEVRREQATRLIDSPAGRARLVSFVASWLEFGELDHADKSTSAYPEFDDELRGEMKDAALAFIEYVLFEGDGRLSTLFTSPTVIATPRLAELYGVPQTDGPVDVPSRPGILTRAAVLTAQSGPSASSPVRRGFLIRHRLLCTEVPPPPPAVDAAIPPASEVETTRDRFELHLSDPSCAACHQLMDPLGFPFEGFDGIGRARSTENGVAVDTSGAFTHGGESVDVADAAEFVAQLAAEPDLAACFAENYRMVGLGRPTTYSEACVPSVVLDTLAAQDGRLVDIVASWVATEDFIRRIK